MFTITLTLQNGEKRIIELESDPEIAELLFDCASVQLNPGESVRMYRDTEFVQMVTQLSARGC